MPNNVNFANRPPTPPLAPEADEDPVVYMRMLRRNGQYVQVTQADYDEQVGYQEHARSPSSSDASSAPPSRSASISSAWEGDIAGLRMSMTGSDFDAAASMAEERRLRTSPRIALAPAGRWDNEQFIARVRAMPNTQYERLHDGLSRASIHLADILGRTSETLPDYNDLRPSTLSAQEMSQDVCPITLNHSSELRQPVAVRTQGDIWVVFEYEAIKEHWDTHHNNPTTRQRLVAQDIRRLPIPELVR